MFAHCRTYDVKSVQYLTAQTRHALREDKTSQQRLRPGATPCTSLSWSIDDGPSPDYVTSFKALKKAKGASERKGAKLGVHVLAGVSPEWVREVGDLHDPANPRNRELLDAARAWADSWSNGGCYAARIDLDETGGAVVDLLIAPTAEQRHKSGKSKLTVSANKALEALAVEHTGRKSRQYSALNTSWAEFAKVHLDARLERGRPKEETGAVHVGPDRYRTMMSEAQAARDAAREAQAAADDIRAQAEAERAAAKLERAEIGAAAMIAAEAAAAVITGDLYRHGTGWKTTNRLDRSKLVPVWAAIRPAVERVASWWESVKAKVDALPDPEAARRIVKPMRISPASAAPEQPCEQSNGPGF